MVETKTFPKWFSRLACFATVFALVVVVLGAYTRLTDAGLGCPDWPGCYGNMILAEGATTEPVKAWTEMIHRYVAGTLGIIILMMFAFTLRGKFNLNQLRGLTGFLVLMVIFQALLGMWTVTWLLHPTVVMGHLMGGMTILSLLWLTYLRTTPLTQSINASCCLAWALGIGLVLVILQIALGGWTSSNYAAMACTDFPTCREVWWPELHMKEAFSMFPPLDKNYEGGWLMHPVKVTIHFMHRLGALVVFLYVAALSLYLIAKQPALRKQSWIVLVLLVVQVLLGISNIIFALPLPVATAHNGVAALLLLGMVTLNTRYWQMRSVPSHG